MVIGIDASRAISEKKTGTEAYAYYLLKALLPLALEAGHQVRLYFNDPPHVADFEGAEIIELTFPRFWTHIRLAWELARNKPDIFFTPAHVIPYTFRGPAVATIHDLGFHYFPEAHPANQLRYLRWSTRHNAKRSARIVADSQATMDDLIRFYGVPAEKIEVVLPAAGPDLHSVSDQERLLAVRRRYKVEDAYLLYIGTLQPRKNLVRLVDAFLESQVPHQLVLAGKTGWLSKSLLDRINSLPEESRMRVRLPGYIEANDKAALISGAGALVFPSLYEGFGFPVLEGNVCGTAVICSNTSSLPEVAGDAALLVDPLNITALSDAIRAVVGDDLLRERLIQAGFQNARRFSWQAAAQKILRTLEAAAVAA